MLSHLCLVVMGAQDVKAAREELVDSPPTLPAPGMFWARQEKPTGYWGSLVQHQTKAGRGDMGTQQSLSFLVFRLPCSADPAQTLHLGQARAGCPKDRDN